MLNQVPTHTRSTHFPAWTVLAAVLLLSLVSLLIFSGSGPVSLAWPQVQTHHEPFTNMTAGKTASQQVQPAPVPVPPARLHEPTETPAPLRAASQAPASQPLSRPVPTPPSNY